MRRSQLDERLRLLKLLGTLAHNRRFTPAEFTEAGGSPAKLRSLHRGGFVRRVGRGEYVPTTRGWALIEGTP